MLGELLSIILGTVAGLIGSLLDSLGSLGL